MFQFGWLLWPALMMGLATASYSPLGIIRPWLARQRTTNPNHRSSHRQPTPQGAGVVVVPVALLGAAAMMTITSTPPPSYLWMHAAASVGGVLALMLLGFRDDRAHLPVSFRLVVQFLASVLFAASLPAELRLTGFAPVFVERGLLILATLWMINLVNFMDGIDWISAVETLAVTGGIGILAALGFLPAWLGAVAATLLAAMIGFMPWNAHPARLFLGDAGSLPIGLLLSALLIHTALAGAYAAALILPLYYLADATWTLGSRLLRRQRFWEAHREHFYQGAVLKGWPVERVIAHVGALNALLVGLAIAATGVGTVSAGVAAFVVAAAATAATLYKFARSKRE